MRGAIFLTVRVVAVLLLLAQAATAGELSRSYENVDVQGWTVRVSSEFKEKDPQLLARCMGVLSQSLWALNRQIPVLWKIRRVAIWLEHDDPDYPGGVYHVSAKWLGEHGRNPAKAGGVQFTRRLATWIADQPMMVLHELAHAYHHQMLTHDYAEINEAYARALKSGRYDSVLRRSGRRERAYALNNAEEFFAELSEAYFGENDYFPFNNSELRGHDPQSYYMIQRAWSRK